MSRISIIILGSLGLMVIGVVFLFINAGKKTETEHEVEVMTKDPEKYTYQQLMAAVGEHGLTLEDQEEKPSGSSQPVVNTELLATDSVIAEGDTMKPETSSTDVAAPEITTALQEIRQTKQQLKSGSAPVVTRLQPDFSQKDKEEDEAIRKIVAQNTATSEPVRRQEQPDHSNIVPAGFNNLQFGQQRSSLSPEVPTTPLQGVILNEAEVISGAVVRILLQDGHRIVSGTVSVGSERVQIRIPGEVVAARYSQFVFSVYGQDGNEGLRIEGGPDPARQATKDEVENHVSQIAGSGILGGVVSIAKTLGTANKGKQQVKIASGLKVTLKPLSH